MTNRSLNEIESQINEVIEQYVQPSVAQHGGSVSFQSFNDGVVIVEMSGSCVGCAMSTATLKYGIERMLVEMVPEVESVEGFDDPEADLMPYYSHPFTHGDWDTVNLLEDDDEPNNRKV